MMQFDAFTDIVRCIYGRYQIHGGEVCGLGLGHKSEVAERRFLLSSHGQSFAYGRKEEAFDNHHHLMITSNRHLLTFSFVYM
jgi:hypothetical protein